MATGERLVVVIDKSKSVRQHFLDRLASELSKHNFRVIRAMSLGGRPIDLHGLMDQVVGPDRCDGAVRAERFYHALSRADTGESRLALIIDDAHLLTEQTIRYLDLLASFASMSPIPLQLLLAGRPQFLVRLPASGSLATDRITTRVTLSDDPAGPQSKGVCDAVPTPLFASRSEAPPRGDAAARPDRATAAASPDRPNAAISRPALSNSNRRQPITAAARRVVARDQPRKSAGGRAAWGMLAGGILFAGGLAAIWFQDQAADLGKLTRLAAAHWPSRSDPISAAHAMPSASPVDLVTSAEAAGHTAPNQLSATVAEGSKPANGMAGTLRPAGSPLDHPEEIATNEAVPAVIEPAPPVAAATAPGRFATTTSAALAMAEQPGQIARPATANLPVAASAMTAVPSSPTAALIPPSAPVVAALLARGDALLSTGDVAAARLMFERAARSDSAPAAVALGMTYDPRLLSEIGAHGVAPDPQRAIFWYRRASDLGNIAAARLLTEMRTITAN